MAYWQIIGIIWTAGSVLATAAIWSEWRRAKKTRERYVAEFLDRHRKG